MTDDPYPGMPVPFVKGSDTSESAADSMKESTLDLRSKVFCIILASPCTCDAVEEKLGGRHQTISARVRELVMEGKIRDSGRRAKTRSGRTARVYEVVTPKEPPRDGRLF